MPIQILPPDEAAKRARERVAEWKRQREIEARTGAVKRKPEPEGPSRAVGRKKRPRGRAIDREREKLNAELLKEVMESGKTQKVMELLDSGADVNAKGPYSGPVICINRRLRDRKAAVQMLLGPGTVVTPLISALVMGDKEILEMLVQNGADVNARIDGSFTALMLAAMQGRVEKAEILVNNGADVNARDINSMTALMWAAGCDCKEIAKMLIGNGADINTNDRFNATALVWAAERGTTETVEMLKRHGAKV